MNIVGRIGLALYLFVIVLLLIAILLELTSGMDMPFGEFLVRLVLVLAMPTAFIVIGGKD